MVNPLSILFKENVPDPPLEWRAQIKINQVLDCFTEFKAAWLLY